jgi:putative GTP pyrophosphokinase
MTPRRPELPSNNRINKAGRCIHEYFIDGSSKDTVLKALGVLEDFRAAHQYPLTKASMGLRSMVATEKCEIEVTQRLKRMPTIIDKIRRHPTMRLAAMQDIGGCRAVLSSIDEVRAVERRIRKNRTPVRVSDYIEEPRSSGYRSLHLVVQYDGRNIEIQLRTKVMHEWAVAVERYAGRIIGDLKSGFGPLEVLEWLHAVSEAMALEEGGSVVGTDQLSRLNELRARALPLLSGGLS